MEDRIRRIVKEYSAITIHNKFHFWPNIPRKKLDNVLKSYAEGVQPSQVLLLVDNTVFGSAKDGAVLTPNQMIAHNPMEDPVRISLKDIKRVSLAEGLVSNIHINDSRFLEMSIPEKQPMMMLAEMLRKIADLFNSTAESTISPMEALKQLKELFDSGIITQEEYEAKRREYLSRL
jgi:hypothetical protein